MDTETTTAVAEYNLVEAGLEALRARFDGVVFDLRTVKGNTEARAARKELVTLRTSLEAKRKELQAPILALSGQINEEAKRITAEIRALEDPIDAAIKADEKRREEERKAKAAAEALRVQRLQDAVLKITETPIRAFGKPSSVIAAEIQALSEVEIGPEFAEFQAGADAAREAALAQLHTMHDTAIAQEAEARRLAEERAELERAKAEEARKAAERAEQERQERERIRAEEKRKADEERAALEANDKAARDAMAAQRAKEDAERAERQRAIDAENARIAEANAAQAAHLESQRKALQEVPAGADVPSLWSILEALADVYHVTPQVARGWLVHHLPALATEERT